MNTASDRFFGTVDTTRIITPIVSRLEYEPVSFTTREEGHIRCENVNAFYSTLYPGPNFGPTAFLQLYDQLIAQHQGNFPIPGWHTYMVANYFLERCNLAFHGEPGYDRWKEVVLMPKMGVANREVRETPLKALNESQAVEQKAPRLVSHTRMLSAASGRYQKLREAKNKANGY